MAARNVEIKARVAAPATLSALGRRAQALSDRPAEQIAQDDTFFRCPNGRLKLRRFADGRGELIAYQRADTAGPRASSYVIVPTEAPDALHEALDRAHGVLGRVRKHRTLVRVGRTRVHLDQIEGLGDFVELEVVLHDGEPESAGRDEALVLMGALGIDAAHLVEGAYLDLLAARGAAAQPGTATSTATSTAENTATQAPHAAIRPFDDADEDAVVALWQVCGLTRPWNDPRRDIARKRTVQPGLFLVAACGGQVVGTAMAGWDGHRGWVYYLGVAPTHRGQGLARALMHAAEQRLQDLGCPKLNVLVRGSNTGVLAFYDALGYQRDAVLGLGRRLIADSLPA